MFQDVCSVRRKSQPWLILAHVYDRHHIHDITNVILFCYFFFVWNDNISLKIWLKVQSLKNGHEVQDMFVFIVSPPPLLWQHALKLASTPQVCAKSDDQCYPSMIWQCSCLLFCDAFVPTFVSLVALSKLSFCFQLTRFTLLFLASKL